MKKSGVFVYIAGKYTDKDMLNTELNIIEAQKLAIELAKVGIPYYCPHTHTRFMDFYTPEVPYEYWMDCCMTAIEKLCNCMLMVHNYKDSNGAKVEAIKAVELDYPIFYSLQDFLGWYTILED